MQNQKDLFREGIERPTLLVLQMNPGIRDYQPLMVERDVRRYQKSLLRLLGRNARSRGLS